MFRPASEADLTALRDLERSANTAALGHVFPPEEYPFPDDDVLKRWQRTLAEGEVNVLVLDDETGGGLVLYAAYDPLTLRHLAVRPDQWGHGLATVAIETVLHNMDLSGTTIASLWCLEENRRARRLYEWLGWRPSRERRAAPWPPYPTEMRYTRLVIASER